MNSNGADWVAFCIKFICGAIVGAVAVFLILGSSSDKYPWRNQHLAAGPDWSTWGCVTLGAALIAGALSSYFGHAIWYKILDFGSIIPPAEPRHSPTSKTIAFLIALTGLGFVLVPLAKKGGFFS